MKLKLLAAALVAAFVTPACVIVSDDDGYYDDDHNHVEPDTAYYTTIDADHLLDTDLGYGAGLFVEYSRGGRWTLWTSCDTELTGSLCLFEAHVTTQSSTISDVLEFDTEGFDEVSRWSDTSLTFYAETASHSDALEFYTAPGELVQIRLVLDGYESPEYLVWYGNDDVQDGAPRSPVVFQPDAP